MKHFKKKIEGIFLYEITAKKFSFPINNTQYVETSRIHVSHKAYFTIRIFFPQIPPSGK